MPNQEVCKSHIGLTSHFVNGRDDLAPPVTTHEEDRNDGEHTKHSHQPTADAALIGLAANYCQFYLNNWGKYQARSICQ